MVQSWNTAGITRVAHSLLHRLHDFVPHIRVAGIWHVDFALLRALGFRGVVIDKDNTLTLPYQATLHPQAAVCSTSPKRVLLVATLSWIGN
jgi:phosphatidylglycerophosphatase GEP4